MSEEKTQVCGCATCRLNRGEVTNYTRKITPEEIELAQKSLENMIKAEEDILNNPPIKFNEPVIGRMSCSESNLPNCSDEDMKRIREDLTPMPKPTETQKKEISFAFSYPTNGLNLTEAFNWSIVGMLLSEGSKPAQDKLLTCMIRPEHTCYIETGRGFIVKEFVRIGAGTHLIMCDTDIAFEPNILEQFEGAIKLAEQMGNEAYIIAARVDLGNGLPVFYTQNEDYSREYNIQPFNGLREFDLVGTGLICISRKAIDKMLDHFKQPNLFNLMTVQDGKRTMGDDFSFCLRARECGISIYGAWNIFGQHYKMYPVKSAYSSSLRID